MKLTLYFSRIRRKKVFCRENFSRNSELTLYVLFFRNVKVLPEKLYRRNSKFWLYYQCIVKYDLLHSSSSLLQCQTYLIIIQCDAIRSEQLKIWHFSWAYSLWITRLDNLWKYNNYCYEYGLVGVLKIKMNSLVEKL